MLGHNTGVNKARVQQAGSAAVGSFISYLAAGIGISLLLFNGKRRDNFSRLSFKKNIFPMVIAGLFTAAGQLLYYAALGKGNANTIAPLVSIEVLFIYIMSYFINRRGEVFTLKIALGMLTMVAGTFLLFR